jgi:ElaB/YqjD/DUF883 family membrane-anchored ribosome-binding protein
MITLSKIEQDEKAAGAGISEELFNFLSMAKEVISIPAKSEAQRERWLKKEYKDLLQKQRQVMDEYSRFLEARSQVGVHLSELKKFNIELNEITNDIKFLQYLINE